MSAQTSPENLALWRRPTVQAKTGLRTSTLYEHVANGSFPKPIRIGLRSVAWLSTDVDGWIAARIAASRNAPSETAPIVAQGTKRKARRASSSASAS